MIHSLTNNKLILVITTERDYEHADKLSKTLLTKKVAACVNLIDLKSLYWWEGKIEESKEVQITIKTSEEKLSKLLLDIKSLHSYSVPEILYWPVASEEKYERWLREILLSS